MNSRRDFLKLLSLFSFAGSAPLLQAQELKRTNQPEQPVRIGYLPITDTTPLLVAHAQKLFEKQGIKAEKPIMFRSWSQLIEVFLSGEVNLVHLLSPMSLWLKYAANAPVKAVMWNHLAGSALTVQPQIERISDLGGKTVAIPVWYSIHNIVVQQLLQANNLSVTTKKPKENEVKLVVMSPSDMVTALANGVIAGFIVAEPFNALAEAKGVGKILRFSADVWRDHACCLTMMHEQDVTERPEWTQKVVNALTKSQVFCVNQPLEVAKTLARGNDYTPHSQEVLEKVLAPSEQQWAEYLARGAVKHPEWHTHVHQQRIGFQPYPFDSYMEKLVEFLQTTKLAGNNGFLAELNPTQVAHELNAPQFVKKSLEQGDYLTVFGLQNGFERVEEIDV